MFLIMPFFVETVMPERTCVTVCLMVPFAVYALEGMGTGLSLLHFEPWSISLQVFFTVPCLLSVVFGVMRFITFYAPRPMCSAC